MFLETYFTADNTRLCYMLGYIVGPVAIQPQEMDAVVVRCDISTNPITPVINMFIPWVKVGQDDF